MLSEFGILLVFYLYLLARWQHVKRPSLYLLGSLGILAHFCAEFFLAGDGATVCMIVQTIGKLVAFMGVVLACFGGELPVQISKTGEAK